MTAGKYNFTIEQGTTFTKTFSWSSGGSPVNLTGFTPKMQIRSRNGSLILDVTNLTGGLTLNAGAGQVVVTIDSATTTGLSFDQAVYDLKLLKTGDDTRLVQGTVTFSPQVTA